MTSVFTSSVTANHVTTENETEQSITFPNSLEERKGLLLKDNSARVAERQPHFSFVLDSVTSVADAFTSLPKRLRVQGAWCRLEFALGNRIGHSLSSVASGSCEIYSCLQKKQPSIS